MHQQTVTENSCNSTNSLAYFHSKASSKALTPPLKMLLRHFHNIQPHIASSFSTRVCHTRSVYLSLSSLYYIIEWLPWSPIPVGESQMLQNTKQITKIEHFFSKLTLSVGSCIVLYWLLGSLKKKKKEMCQGIKTDLSGSKSFCK